MNAAAFGGAAGGAIVLILLVAGLCMWRRHRRKQRELHDEDWFAVPGHHHPDATPDPASLYAAQAQEYYPPDAKRVVMSADAPLSPASGSSTALVGQVPEVPPQLSQEEMARLADLVARRMRAYSDAEEPPPTYQ